MKNSYPVSPRTLASCVGIGIVLVLLSLAAGFNFHSANGGAVAFAFKWLSLPLLVFWLTVAFHTNALGKELVQKMVSAIILTVFLCSIGSSGLLMWLNAGIGYQIPVLVYGNVVSKSPGGIKGYPTVSVQADNILRIVRLEVSRREYDTVEIGRPYQRQMHVGLLGIMYAPAR